MCIELEHETTLMWWKAAAWKIFTDWSKIFKILDVIKEPELHSWKKLNSGSFDNFINDA